MRKQPHLLLISMIIMVFFVNSTKGSFFNEDSYPLKNPRVCKIGAVIGGLTSCLFLNRLCPHAPLQEKCLVVAIGTLLGSLTSFHLNNWYKKAEDNELSLTAKIGFISPFLCLSSTSYILTGRLLTFYNSRNLVFTSTMAMVLMTGFNNIDNAYDHNILRNKLRKKFINSPEYQLEIIISNELENDRDTWKKNLLILELDEATMPTQENLEMIKKQFKTLSLKYHPDKQQLSSSDSKYKEVVDARDKLLASSIQLKFVEDYKLLLKQYTAPEEFYEKSNYFFDSHKSINPQLVAMSTVKNLLENKRFFSSYKEIIEVFRAIEAFNQDQILLSLLNFLQIIYQAKDCYTQKTFKNYSLNSNEQQQIYITELSGIYKDYIDGFESFRKVLSQAEDQLYNKLGKILVFTSLSMYVDWYKENTVQPELIAKENITEEFKYIIATSQKIMEVVEKGLIL